MTYRDGLTTERLITRFLTAEDTVAWVEFFSHDRAPFFLPNEQNLGPEERAKAWMDRCLGRYAEGSLGMQALLLRDTGEFIGMCGLLVQVINGNNLIEVGYHLLPRFWGKGYATEAARAFRDYAFMEDTVPFVVSVIHPGNLPSQKVAGRNGMQLAEGNVVFRGHEYDMYRITRKEWETLEKQPFIHRD